MSLSISFLRLQIFILLLSLICSPSVAFSAPVLNFSDLIAGPSSGLGDGLGEGVIVTVWGNNLGSSQGTSTISIGGESPAYIYYWKNADGEKPGGPADLYTYHQMQEIAFSIPSTLSDGAYTISVTVDGETSNTLPFTVRSGNIYHAMTSGDSANDGSFTSPWLSWVNGGGLANMVAGDILYMHDGTSDYNSSANIISGKTGTIDNQLAVVAYPNSRYTITGVEKSVDFYNSNSFVLSKLRSESGYFDEPDVSSEVALDKIGGTGIEGAAYSRLIANEITEIAGKCSSGYSGAIVASCGGGSCDPISNLKVFGNYIHDWGCDQTSHFEHTTYFSVRNDGYTNVAPWEIGWNLLKDNKAKYGLHNYDETYDEDNVSCGNPTGAVKIHDNYVINQKGPGINIGSRAPEGYVCWYDGSFEVYNNVIVNAGNGPEYTDFHSVEPYGVQLRDAGMATPIKFYNNTIYGSGDAVEGTGISIEFGDTTNDGNFVTTFTNNIIVDTKGDTYMRVVETDYDVSGSNNLFYSTNGTLDSTIDSRLTSSVFGNPDFVSGTDLRLTVESPAIDSGVVGLHSTDIMQTSRPQGPGYDIGAYEYKNTLIPPQNVKVDTSL